MTKAFRNAVIIIIYGKQTFMSKRSYSTVCILSPTAQSVNYHNSMNTVSIISAQLAADQCYLGIMCYACASFIITLACL